MSRKLKKIQNIALANRLNESRFLEADSAEGSLPESEKRELMDYLENAGFTRRDNVTHGDWWGASRGTEFRLTRGADSGMFVFIARYVMGDETFDPEHIVIRKQPGNDILYGGTEPLKAMDAVRRHLETFDGPASRDIGPMGDMRGIDSNWPPSSTPPPNRNPLEYDEDY